MPTFNLTLERGGKTYNMTVDAATQAEAETAAVQELDNPKYWSEEERAIERQRLTEEKRQIGNELEAATRKARPPIQIGNVGLNLTKENLAAGAARVGAGVSGAVLGVGETIADTFGAEDTAQWIRDHQASVEAAAVDLNEQAFTHSMGRAPTEREKEDLRESTNKWMDRSELVADIGLALGPAGVLSKAKTFKAALALGAGEGALSTYLLADSEAETASERLRDRVGNAAVGAVFGGLVNGAFVGLPAAFKNSFARYVDKEIEAAGGRAAFAQAQEDVGGMLTIGQWTGNPKILLAEQRAAAQLAQGNVVGQKAAVIKKIGDELGVTLPDLPKDLGRGTRRMLEEYTQGVSSAINREKGLVNKTFRARMGVAEKIHEGPAVWLQDMGDDVARIIEETKASFGTRRLSEGATEMLDTILDAGKNGASPAQLNRWLSNINAMRDAKGRGFFSNLDGLDGDALLKMNDQAMAHLGVLRHGLLEAIGKAAPASGTRGQAIEIMRQARNIYGKRKNALSRVEKEVLHALGMEGKTALEVIERMSKIDPDEIGIAVKMLRKMEGGEQALGKLKEALIHGAAQGGASGTAKSQGARLGGFNMADFLQNFARNSEDAVASGILKPSEAARANRALDSARRIMNSTVADSGVNLTVQPLELSNIAINFVSRDPGFIARLLGSVMEKGAGAEKLFFTKEGVDMLSNLAEVTVGGKLSASMLASANAGTLWLLDSLADSGWQETLAP